MSQNSFEIEFKIKPTKFEIEMKDVVKEVFPELEDLEVIPTAEEQKFKSEMYGYNNVTVKAIETKEITIQPGTEEQVKEGIFNKVTVLGDEDLKPENIKKGTNIFGVEGIGNMFSGEISNTSYLFYNGARLTILYDLLSICKNVTTTLSMFDTCRNLTTLDLSNFDTSSVTDMRNMFSTCNDLKTLDLSNFDTSNVTDMYGMFKYCSDLTSLDLNNFNTSNVKGMAYMFNGCTNLVDLNISSFDMGKVEAATGFFQYTRNIVNLRFGKNLGKNYQSKQENAGKQTLDLSELTKLTHDSLMSVINNLYDLNITYSLIGDGTLYRQNLKLGSTNLAKLTAEEIAIATNKGWNVT